MDSGLLHYLLFSGSRRSGRGTFHARCGDGEPAGYCCHLHSPNLGRGQRGKGLREWGLPRVSEEAYLAGAMQDAVGRGKEGAKTREHLRGWVGVPRAWLGTLEWSPSPPTLHPPFSPPNLPSYPQKQPCICALSTATQTPLSNSRSHKGKWAEKTGTPPPTPAPSDGTIKASLSLPIWEDAAPLLPSPHHSSPCPPMEKPGLRGPWREAVGQAWGPLETAAEACAPLTLSLPRIVWKKLEVPRFLPQAPPSVELSIALPHPQRCT